MDTSPSRTLLSIREVAARWGVSPNLVRRLIWDGMLTSTRFSWAVLLGR